MTPIETIYIKYLKEVTSVSYRDSNRMLFQLQLLGYALYLKNLTKDPRTLEELKVILQEEFNLYG